MTGSPNLRAPWGQPIAFIVCPTGGWWAHEQHPADGHDAFPPNGDHATDDPNEDPCAGCPTSTDPWSGCCWADQTA